MRFAFASQYSASSTRTLISAIVPSPGPSGNHGL